MFVRFSFLSVLVAVAHSHSLWTKRARHASLHMSKDVTSCEVDFIAGFLAGNKNCECSSGIASITDNTTTCADSISSNSKYTATTTGPEFFSDSTSSYYYACPPVTSDNLPQYISVYSSDPSTSACAAISDISKISCTDWKAAAAAPFYWSCSSSDSISLYYNPCSLTSQFWIPDRQMCIAVIPQTNTSILGVTGASMDQAGTFEKFQTRVFPASYLSSSDFTVTIGCSTYNCLTPATVSTAGYCIISQTDPTCDPAIDPFVPGHKPPASNNTKHRPGGSDDTNSTSSAADASATKDTSDSGSPREKGNTTAQGPAPMKAATSFSMRSGLLPFFLAPLVLLW